MGEINLIIIVGDFNTPLSMNDSLDENQQEQRRLEKEGTNNWTYY